MKELTDRQRRLLLWRDYFQLLGKGLSNDRGVPSDEERELSQWLKVLRTEAESDILHLESGQPEYCRFEEPKDLSELSLNNEP